MAKSVIITHLLTYGVHVSFKKNDIKSEPLEILVIHAHPDKKDFCHAITETAVLQIERMATGYIT
jgi:hypothetical protein